jgi:hypothetical protein
MENTIAHTHENFDCSDRDKVPFYRSFLISLQPLVPLVSVVCSSLRSFTSPILHPSFYSSPFPHLSVSSSLRILISPFTHLSISSFRSHTRIFLYPRMSPCISPPRRRSVSSVPLCLLYVCSYTVSLFPPLSPNLVP